jgi:hypothetical protein
LIDAEPALVPLANIALAARQIIFIADHASRRAEIDADRWTKLAFDRRKRRAR